MNAIKIRQLCKEYPGFSLKNVNLILPQGCIMGLVGENGAGKSTTIKLMLDMISRDRGTITILGRDNRENFQLTKEDLGIVLDEVSLPAHLSARQIEKIMKNTYKNWDTQVFYGYVKAFSVPENKKIRELSRGMKMKLGLAVALSHAPKLLILDEATSGLDPVVRDEILDVFLDFTRDETHAILICSHIISDLEKICDYIAFLHRGQLMLCEEKDVLREQYGLLRCTKEVLDELMPEAVCGKKETPYGMEALVKRDMVPQTFSLSPVDIEQVFIFMTKEAEK